MFDNLVDISTSSLGSREIDLKELEAYLLSFGIEDKSYIELIRLNNGFLAFESALTLYPYDRGIDLNLESWNALSVWKDKYSFIKKPFICFAQDVFGFQFCLTKDGIEFLDPETGELEYLTSTTSEWFDLILKDYEYLTGFPIAHEWQSNFGKTMNSTMRLTPKVPFVLGGKHDLSNLYVNDVYTIINFRSDLAKKIHSLEDGEEISIKLI